MYSLKFCNEYYLLFKNMPLTITIRNIYVFIYVYMCMCVYMHMCIYNSHMYVH